VPDPSDACACPTVRVRRPRIGTPQRPEPDAGSAAVLPTTRSTREPGEATGRRGAGPAYVRTEPALDGEVDETRFHVKQPAWAARSREATRAVPRETPPPRIPDSGFPGSPGSAAAWRADPPTFRLPDLPASRLPAPHRPTLRHSEPEPSSLRASGPGPGTTASRSAADASADPRPSVPGLPVQGDAARRRRRHARSLLGSSTTTPVRRHRGERRACAGRDPRDTGRDRASARPRTSSGGGASGPVPGWRGAQADPSGPPPWTGCAPPAAMRGVRST
jgi:hypothetical protein